ncbi:hypothetical protein QL285_019125 [Trifolium repens]|jgi:hypothetical protein|nr:hypothetical protein QL285_019125 [Trifolium repens]
MRFELTVQKHISAENDYIILGIRSLPVSFKGSFFVRTDQQDHNKIHSSCHAKNLSTLKHLNIFMSGRQEA